MGQRLLTFIVDKALLIGLAKASSPLLASLPGVDALDDSWLGAHLPAAMLVLLYYIGFEAVTGRTVGKLVTGTQVVNTNGALPTFGQVVGRSFVRLIPFEPFSFIFLDRGWHDHWSGTRVVRVRG